MNPLAVLRPLAALICLGAVSATGPQQITLQIVDPAGLPLRDAVVEIAPPPGAVQAFAFPQRLAMAQRNQQFVPGTLLVAKGANVAFPNLDNVRHSIYSFSKPARFRIELYGQDQTRSQRFEVAGTVALGCNIHDQMRGYIRVVSTPFAATTDLNGYGKLSGLGPGTYQITVWHPRLRGPDSEMHLTLKVAGTSPNRITVPVR